MALSSRGPETVAHLEWAVGGQARILDGNAFSIGPNQLTAVPIAADSVLLIAVEEGKV